MELLQKENICYNKKEVNKNMSIKKSKYLIALCAGTALAGVIPSTLVSCSSASPFKIGIDGSNTVDLTYQTSAAFNFIYKHNDSKYSKATGFSSVEIVNVSSAISHNFKVVSWSSDLSKNNNIKVNFSMDIIGE